MQKWQRVIKKFWNYLLTKIRRKRSGTTCQYQHYTVSKMDKGGKITTDTLGKVCDALDFAVWKILWILYPTQIINNMKLG